MISTIIVQYWFIVRYILIISSVCFSLTLCVMWSFTIDPLCRFHPDLRLKVIVHKQCKCNWCTPVQHGTCINKGLLCFNWCYKWALRIFYFVFQCWKQIKRIWLRKLHKCSRRWWTRTELREGSMPWYSWWVGADTVQQT